MKNIVLSAVAVLAMSSFAVAGGDIAPVEEPVVVVEPVITDSGFYIGGAYGAANFDYTETYDAIDMGGGSTYTPSGFSDDWDYSTVMIQAGYKFNQYVAIEARYWFGMDETLYTDSVDGDVDLTVDTFGIYIKPMYPVTDAFDIYALLGYANNDASVEDNEGTYDFDSVDGFSWGIGAAYSFTDNLAVFVDYVNMYEDDNDVIDEDGDRLNQDITLSTVNFGLSYKF